MTAETASIRLSYIINHDVTKAAMKNFSARTGISLAADATDGYQIPPGLPQNDFCLIMQNFGRCEMVPNASAPLHGDEPQLRYDGAQIGHLIIPICDDRHLLGRLVSEPFAVSKPDFATVYELARALPVHPDNLMRAVESVPVVSQAHIMEAGNLVHTGLFVGDDLETYLAAARQAREQNITVLDEPLKKVRRGASARRLSSASRSNAACSSVDQTAMASSTSGWGRPRSARTSSDRRNPAPWPSSRRAADSVTPSPSI